MITITGKIKNANSDTVRNLGMSIITEQFITAVGSDKPNVYRFYCPNTKRSDIEFNGVKVNIDDYGIALYDHEIGYGNIIEITVDNNLNPRWTVSARVFNVDGRAPTATLRNAANMNGEDVLLWLSQNGILKEGSYEFYFDEDAEFDELNQVKYTKQRISQGIIYYEQRLISHGGFRRNGDGLILHHRVYNHTFPYTTIDEAEQRTEAIGRKGDVIVLTVTCSAQRMTNENQHRMTYGLHDAMLGEGKILRDVASKLIYVVSEDNLDELWEEQPGTIAAMYGLGQMWQKLPDGTWTEI